MLRRRGDRDIEAAIRDALDRKHLSMQYQPKIRPADGSFSGVEALMRLKSPVFGSLPPSLFIPVAERCGLIDPLSEWGLRNVLAQWANWHAEGIDVPIAFNISALTLGDGSYPDFVERLCKQHDVPANQITVEVTEGATQRLERLLDAVTRFRIKGFGVELDDFGTGYSSLLQLKQLPYSGVKIDAHFVSQAATDLESRVIIKAVIEMAHGLGLTATAEGVEDEEALYFLSGLRCDHAQGFRIAPPLDADALPGWIDDQKSAAANWPAALPSQR